MRRRLLLSTLAVAVVAILLLGIPLAYIAHKLVYEEAGRSLDREASSIAGGVGYRLESRLPVTGAEIAREFPGRHIAITLPDGRTVTAGPPRRGRVLSAAAAHGAVRVRVSRPEAQVRDEALRRLLLIVSLALLGVAVTVGLAMVQARRLTLPLIDLAETADRLGSGNARPRPRRYGIPEVDRVAEVLDHSAVRITDLLIASREFASDASHQLRTPLTALSMRLEEMIEAADYPDVVREEGAAAVAQTERLVAVVEQLLARARHDRTGGAVPSPIDEIIRQQVEEWRPSFRKAGRDVRIVGEQGLVGMTNPEGLSQIIATLLENSLMHGAGTVTIHTKPGASSVVVEIGDEGSGIPSELEPRIFERTVSGGRGTGLGLYLARSLAVVDGGRLELIQARPAVFGVFLREAAEARLAAERVVIGPA
ncbi:ATP-binding protein [Actinomadura madurae]|uniref:Signal transduction histidine-protein kinase/phosphatase MprB n=1 Tax=Actinomadura madurae TaxID=1993 RepID=A0A1I5C168_9ACTN|nr:ATP-binding protein [Actinomadura madurae]URM96145.1 ATP-binding protein [Actinomadura madurae]URN06849.1 ATP-binding protein [Actinomadura madurae]SFN80728.1 Signal transduction histidine kinase [Actinomadura madurae]SPT50855.1 Signal transduction histidine-protein kinase ArlS [Actinomadura madurae]